MSNSGVEAMGIEVSAKFLVAHFLLAFMSPIAVAGFLDVNYNVT
jgi:hypothetical protein